MAKTDIINTRVEPALKHSAEAVLQHLGLSTSEAITLFLHQVVLHEGLPFDVKVPNTATAHAMRNAITKKNLTRYESLEALKHELD